MVDASGIGLVSFAGRCRKIVFGQRLKLSGHALDNQGCQRHYRAEMLSTESGRWEAFWESRATG